MNELEIIIPAYNAHETILETLNSIVIQKNLPKYHISLVNDCGNDYKQIVDKYKKSINIDEIKTPSNGGPGLARQYGIDNSKSKYIVFIDADDLFYDENSLNKLYNRINKTNVDLVISSFIYERDGEVKEKTKDTIWLHGKIYRRSFLEKHNIRFNNTSANEDNGFNSLLLMLKPATIISNDLTYIYKENPNSITRRGNREYRLSGLEGLAYNLNWAIEEAEKRKAPIDDVAWKSLDALLVMYLNYNILFKNRKVDNILRWSIDLYNKYLKYKEINKDRENQMIKDREAEKVYISFVEFKEKIKALTDNKEKLKSVN